MVKTEEVTQEVRTQALFAKATTDLSMVKGVSAYIRTGKQWDFTHKEVMGDILVIHRCKEIHTKYGDARLIDCDRKGVQVSVLIGGQVLVQQLDDLMPHLPVIAVIAKPARAYTFIDPSQKQLSDYQAKYIDILKD